MQVGAIRWTSFQLIALTDAGQDQLQPRTNHRDSRACHAGISAMFDVLVCMCAAVCRAQPAELC
jgi:hypothetical protein